MQNKNLLILVSLVVLVVLVVALGFVWWRQTRLKPVEQPESQVPGVEQTEEQPVSPVSFVVEGDEFKFSPNGFEVRAGQPVRITFVNVGSVPHNFSIPELGVSTNTIGPGERETIQFTPDQPGSYEIVCTVPGHKEAGMVGTLDVLE